MARSTDAAQLIACLRDSRERLLALFVDLTDDQLIGPKLDIVNPPIWEVGHVAWFHERWVLREFAGRAPFRPDCDAFYDSAADVHHERWARCFPTRESTLEYLTYVLEGITAELDAHPDDGRLLYFARLGLSHEDMHVEAMLYTRQTLGIAPPAFVARGVSDDGGEHDARGDVEIPGGVYTIGATPDEAFVHDNEKWAHDVELAPFRMARHAVTQAQFAEFVDAGGYASDGCWSDAGLRWRAAAQARQPVYWTRASSGAWRRRAFDREVALEPQLPMLHVNWFEAEAFCAWSGRRLPTEYEWEAAAALQPGGGKRRYPWGATMPTEDTVQMNFEAGGCAPVDRKPDGDSSAGCRQMLGNVWEWTASAFEPYPGFEVDPYREYSAPWFGTRKVLRGGSWATRCRGIRNTWRNFFTPDRRDIWSGFRTCAR